MKVIAKVDSDKYICEVNHTEIEKFMNLYYGNLKRLEVGSQMDLGKGYDYHSQILDAMRKTEAFIEAHQDIIKSITDGLVIAVRGHVPDKKDGDA